MILIIDGLEVSLPESGSMSQVITRPPSAELAPDQQDSDSLPGYDVLDAILERYIEGDMSAEAIIDAGFASEDVYKVVKLVDRSEYKRRQAPVGVRAEQAAGLLPQRRSWQAFSPRTRTKTEN